LKDVLWHERARAEASAIAEEDLRRAETAERLKKILCGMHVDKSPFYDLPYWANIHGPLRGIQLDFMHIGGNLLKKLVNSVLPAILPNIPRVKTVEACFQAAQKRLDTIRLPPPVTENVKNCLPNNKRKANLPTLKTIDWIRFFQLEIVLFALVDIVPYPVFGFLKLLCGCIRGLVSSSFNEDSIISLERKLWFMLSVYEAFIPPHHRGGWQWHLLIHLPLLIRLNGPLVDNWNFAAEAMLGVIKRWSKSMKKPIESIANTQAVFSAVTLIKVRLLIIL
jgi:hypothetical protein